ncbi:hypothetical protein [Cellulomonas sp. Leaf334]|uniref:hypothetical protein n=1 Tax=Cellulomonas sp. Leaf334 TaxID=1736339 RepID=UPI0006FF075E|nr:hypothetical protein [Cellulomonas sp. Leaf334]KQR10434.1 hypothetical protein ASF78_17255 [Cellulomonas sp. Leaf334]
MANGAFELDGYEGYWPAVRFGDPWNGWATPVVTGTVLAGLLAHIDGGHRWDGDCAIVWPTADLMPGEPHDPDIEDRISPDIDGQYDLGALGWTFVEHRPR